MMNGGSIGGPPSTPGEDQSFTAEPPQPLWLMCAYDIESLATVLPGSRFPLPARARHGRRRYVLTSGSEMTRFGIAFCVMGLLLGAARAAFAGPFEVRDTSWEGCSSSSSWLERSWAKRGWCRCPSSTGRISSRTTRILIFHPEHAVASEKLAAFLGAGGRVAVLDDFGAGNEILERFQIERVPAPTPTPRHASPQPGPRHRRTGARADRGTRHGRARHRRGRRTAGDQPPDRPFATPSSPRSSRFASIDGARRGARAGRQLRQ